MHGMWNAITNIIGLYTSQECANYSTIRVYNLTCFNRLPAGRASSQTKAEPSRLAYSKELASRYSSPRPFGVNQSNSCSERKKQPWRKIAQSTEEHFHKERE